MQSPFRDNRYLNGFFFFMSAPQGLEANSLLKISDNNSNNFSKLFMACQICSMNTSRKSQSFGKLNLILLNLLFHLRQKPKHELFRLAGLGFSLDTRYFSFECSFYILYFQGKQSCLSFFCKRELSKSSHRTKIAISNSHNWEIFVMPY